MGVLTLTQEYTSPISADKAFKLSVLDYDTLVPKILPQVVKSIELLSGDGGAGSVKQVNFAEGGPWKYMKVRTDVLDKEKKIYNFSTIDGEGEAKMDTVELVSYETKMEDTPGGGNKSTTVIKFFPKPGCEIKEEEVKEGLEKQKGVYQALEAYAMANPEVLA